MTPTKPVEHPILFSGGMVAAILAGRKTQTRRPVRPGGKSCGEHVRYWEAGEGDFTGRWCGFDGLGKCGDMACPYGRPGDRLWVRETWGRTPRDLPDGIVYRAHAELRYFTEADGQDKARALGIPRDGHWRPSIHMPRWASRISLEVTGVRVERVQDITEEDARAEGVDPFAAGACPVHREGHLYCDAFSVLWDEINGKRKGCSWAANPWVWAVGFRRTDSAADKEGA